MPRSLVDLAPEDLVALRESTLAHYDEGARSFWEGTRDHDVSQNLDALLRHLPGEPPAAILDLGCGPGRDLRALRERGHRPVGLDGSAAFVAMARALSGCEVLHQDFLALALEDDRFDGVFANASLFHVPSQELPRVLAELHRTLRAGGILFASNPRGPDREGFQGRRYGSYLREDTWRAYVREAGFEELDSYYRPPGLPRDRQPWFASIWRR